MPTGQGTNFLGNLGEAYTILELAKRGHFAMRVSRGCNFDLLCDNGARVEVKSARCSSGPRSYPQFRFMNIRTKYTYKGSSEKYHGWEIKKSACDFYVFVLFNDANEPILYLILPRSKFKTACISANPKNLKRWAEFANRWDLLTGKIE